MKYLFAFLLLLPMPGLAADWGHANIRDVGRDEDGVNWIAIEFSLAENWKTYWKFAGQNGLDPLITLTQEGEEIAADIHWPMPHLFLTDDLPALGYKGEFLLPISFRGEGDITLNADIGVCEKLCTPAQFEFSVNAQSGYSIEQFILKGKKTSPDAPLCDWSADALAGLDAGEYWMFTDGQTGLIAQKFSEIEGEISPDSMGIYRLHDAGIEALDCAEG